MKKIIASVLLVLVGLTSCTPTVPVQPIITYTPTNTTATAPVITPSGNPIIITPANTATPPPVIITAANPITITANSSLNTTATPLQTNNDILQICFNGTFSSYGVAVKDGSYIFTILKYIDFDLSNGGLSVVSPEGSFPASVFAFDPRTGATLLKLKDHLLKPVELVASSNISAGQQAIVWQWNSHLRAGIEGVVANVTSAPGTSDPVKFGIAMPPFAWNSDGDERTVVTDAGGAVLGFIRNEQFSASFSSNGVLPPGPPPPRPDSWLYRAVISSDMVETLLSPDISKQPWANGPVSFDILDVQAQTERRTVFSEAPGNYNYISAELQALFKEVGPPLTDNESKIMLTRRSGQSVSVYYASPVTLYSGNQAIARARWVNIEWDRLDGLPDNLIYGDSPRSGPVGGFIITSNISTLKKYLNSPYF